MSHRSLFRTGSLVFILALILTTQAPGAALAQGGDTKQVGLVVTFADGKTQTEVVTVPSNATSLDVLRAAKLTIATAESSQGTSLCKINDSGCPAENCFCDAEHYWAYYHLSGNEWAAAAEGAGTYVPANRAVEGFAWSAFDAQFNPTTKPPVSTFEQLAVQAQGASRIGPGPVILAVVLVLAIIVLVVYLLRSRKRA